MNKKTIALILALTVFGTQLVSADEVITEVTLPVQQQTTVEVKPAETEEAVAVEPQEEVADVTQQEDATVDSQEVVVQENTPEEQLTPEEEAFLNQLTEEDFKKLLDELIKLQEQEKAAQ